MKTADRVKNVAEVAALAQPTDLKRNKELHETAQNFLAIEEPAAMLLRSAAGSPNVDPKIVKQYPVLDMDFLSRSLKWHGFIFREPLPRFAFQDVKAADLHLEARIDVKDTRGYYDNSLYNGYFVRLGRIMRRNVQKLGALMVTFALGFGVGAFFYLGTLLRLISAGADSSDTAIVAFVLGILNVIIAGLGIALITKPDGDYKVTLKTRFGGVLPENIRQLIVSNVHRFDNIGLVYEVGKWEMTTEKQPVRIVDRDPLVVGRKNGVYYLLAKFDTTPAEEWVKAEFGS